MPCKLQPGCTGKPGCASRRRRRRTLAGSSTSSRLHSCLSCSTASSAADISAAARSSTAQGGRESAGLSASAPGCRGAVAAPAGPLTCRVQPVYEGHDLRHRPRLLLCPARRLVLRDGRQGRRLALAASPGHGGCRRRQDAGETATPVPAAALPAAARSCRAPAFEGAPIASCALGWDAASHARKICSVGHQCYTVSACSLCLPAASAALPLTAARWRLAPPAKSCSWAPSSCRLHKRSIRHQQEYCDPLCKRTT